MASLTPSRLDATFDLLTHAHRRYVMYHLANESARVGIETLATAIANWNQDHPKSERSTDFESIKAALYHTHLPKLVDGDFITVSANMDSIELVKTDGLDQFLADTASIDGYGQTVASAD